ncbi:MAG TPA: SH3 domain-containing protein [Blastocatellia bacterium]|nr:SH3 domain-containing protein [Blastocatellia bacterium]
MKRFINCLKLYSCAAIIISLPALMASCSPGSTPDEQAVVLNDRLRLRNSTAQAARVVGELKSGDQVTVIDRGKAEDGEDWAKVKGPNGEEGWLRSSNLVKREIVEKSRQIAAEIKEIPTQAVGKSKATLKLRLSPDRSDDENVATTLPAGTMLEIVARERKPRPARIEGKGEAKEEPDANIRYDNWYEVRLKDYAVLPAGWIYGDSVELEIPGEIFYFVSSGRKIVGWQKIGSMTGADSEPGANFLALERKNSGADDGVDFDRVKVLAYDPSSRDYVTPFREDISGRFPVTLKMDGPRGRFEIIAVDKNGQTRKLSYGIELLDGGKVKVAKPVSN